MHARRHLATLALLTFLSALAGCSDDAEPKAPDPTPTPSSTEPTTPPPTTQTTPPEDETPRQFIRRWQSAGNEMQVTGDIEDYLDLTHGCQSCQSFADTVERIYAKGGHVETDGGRVTKIAQSGGSERAPAFDVDIESGPTIYYESSNGPKQTLPGGTVRYLVLLAHKPEGWVVTDFSEYNS